MTLLSVFLIFIGIILSVNIFLPFLWPLKWVYFFMFRPKEQKRHVQMIKNIKEHLIRRGLFYEKIKKLEDERN